MVTIKVKLVPATVARVGLQNQTKQALLTRRTSVLRVITPKTARRRRAVTSKLRRFNIRLLNGLNNNFLNNRTEAILCNTLSRLILLGNLVNLVSNQLNRVILTRVRRKLRQIHRHTRLLSLLLNRYRKGFLASFMWPRRRDG